MAEQAPSIVKSTLTSYVNHGLTLLFAYLAQKGLRADSILTPENITILAAAVVTGGASVGMQVYRKLKTRRLVQAAIKALPGTLLEQVKTEAASMPLIAK